MWAVVNQTRFKADRAFARDADGAEIWIVAVRATFQFNEHGEISLAEKQQDVCLAPKYFGEPGKSSLKYDMDLVRVKSGTDILLHASAHAPNGEPATSVDVGWSIGPLSKQLRVIGDRTYQRGPLGLTPSRPAPFTTLPIRYERALGGLLATQPDAPRDPINTVGVGRAPILEGPVPNCEFLGESFLSTKAKSLVPGFGPIPCNWPPRVKLAGTYDDAWKKDRQPLVPVDFQNDYFRCAPADQQVAGFLQGGEEVVLRNLTPEGEVSFQLPRVTLGFTTHIDGGTQQHRAQLHTVILEPDDRRLVMVWQTSLPCHHTLYTLKQTTVIEKARVPLGASPESELAV